MQRGDVRRPVRHSSHSAGGSCTLRGMRTGDTLITLAIGGGGVAVAAVADALGVPTAGASLLGLLVVLVLLWIRRAIGGGRQRR